MSKIKFHKANALPNPISQAHDGVWLITDGANNYKHYIITGGVVKELTVDGEDLTLEQARQNGNILEGDVVIGNGSSGQFQTGFVSEYGSSKISFTDEDGVLINKLTGNVNSYIDVYTNYASLNVSNSSLGNQITMEASYVSDEPAIRIYTIGKEDTKGIIGNREYNKQGDRKAFAQIADVEDAINAIPTPNLTLEEARQNGNVLEGDVIFDASDYRSIKNQLGYGIYFGDDGLMGLRLPTSGSSYSTELELSYGQLSYHNTNPSSKGIVGNREFDKQGDRKAFAQIGDIEDAMPDYSSLTNQRHIKKVGSGLANSNIQDTTIGSEVLGRLDSAATVEKRVSTNPGSSFTINLNAPSGHYDVTLSRNTTITFSNMIAINQSTVITLVVEGNYSLLFPSWLKPMPNNDSYNGLTANLITILIRNGGSSPQGVYSLTNVDLS